MKYILEITTKIGCSNMCEYCPQTKLVKRYLNNMHIKTMKKHFDESGDNPKENIHLEFMEEYLKKDKNRTTMMSLETFKKCLSTIHPQVDIHFSGYTEAWDNPHATDMVEYAIKKGHRIGINTTLMGVTKDDIDRLEKLKLKHFHVHLPSATYFENIGRNKASIKNKTGKIISEEYLEILDYIINSSITCNSQLFHTHSATGYKLHPEIELYAGNRIRKKGYRNRGLNSRAGNLGSMKGEALWKNNWCQRIIQNVLLPDGSVQLCCQDYGLEEPIGNLLHMPYEELFETKRFKQVSKGVSPICQKCDDGVAVPKGSMKKLRSMQNYEDEWRKT